MSDEGQAATPAPRPTPAGSRPVYAVLVLLVIACGYLLWRDLKPDPRWSVRPPLIVLSMGDEVRDTDDLVATLRTARKLADGGFLVLDSQAVLAAPEQLFLKASQAKASQVE